MSQRTYHDPLHGAIRLDREDPAEAMAVALIDTAPFQRLRRIRQLGTAFLTFQGAESSRFTHSLGVLHLARGPCSSWSGSTPPWRRSGRPSTPRPCCTTWATPPSAIPARRCMACAMKPGRGG